MAELFLRGVERALGEIRGGPARELADLTGARAWCRWRSGFLRTLGANSSPSWCIASTLPHPEPWRFNFVQNNSAAIEEQLRAQRARSGVRRGAAWSPGTRMGAGLREQGARADRALARMRWRGGRQVRLREVADEPFVCSRRGTRSVG